LNLKFHIHYLEGHEGNAKIYKKGLKQKRQEQSKKQNFSLDGEAFCFFEPLEVQA
jgi:hypothetical protein